jgi:alpha-beta hydrolase superfamily lysophospholipase
VSSFHLIDQPSLLRYLFYPRKDFTPCPDFAFDLFVPVEDNISVSCRFYQADSAYPWILYFHGNGEVVSDYDEMAPFYLQIGLNLVVADYRGYGASDGSPSHASMIKDAHLILEKVVEELKKRELQQDLFVMGRSMGSVSALELAYHYLEKINGLIIESGFINPVRVIKHLNLPLQGTNLEQLEQECLHKVHNIKVAALIIHGESDTLVPLQEARDLFAQLGTENKKLLIIPHADHNNIMFVGFEQYFEELKKFTSTK